MLSGFLDVSPLIQSVDLVMSLSLGAGMLEQRLPLLQPDLARGQPSSHPHCPILVSALATLPLVASEKAQ